MLRGLLRPNDLPAKMCPASGADNVAAGHRAAVSMMPNMKIYCTLNTMPRLVRSSRDAVMTALPGDTAVTKPLLFTVATAGLLLVQMTRLQERNVASLYVHKALNC
jgi:hypothetical protein